MPYTGVNSTPPYLTHKTLPIDEYIPETKIYRSSYFIICDCTSIARVHCKPPPGAGVITALYT